jgi:hypothetical protein
MRTSGLAKRSDRMEVGEDRIENMNQLIAEQVAHISTQVS